MKIIHLFCAGLCCLAALWLLLRSDNTPQKDKRFVINTHHAFRNTWYQVANLTAKRLGFNTSCYVCSLIPHHSEEVPYMTAVPVTLNTTLCLLYTLTINTYNYRCRLPHCCTPEGNRTWTRTLNFTQKTNHTVAKGINLLRLTGRDPFCFSINCTTNSVFLGSSYCEDLLPLPVINCSVWNKTVWFTMRFSKETVVPSRFVTLNTTILSKAIPGFNDSSPSGTLRMEVPSQWGTGTPEGYIWKCGHTFYLYLPKDWCGTCSLARLQPSSYVMSEDGISVPTKLKKREFQPVQAYSPFSSNGGRKPLYGDAQGVFFTLIPHLGISSLMKRMNEVWWTLENITDIITDMTSLLADDPEKQAMRTMLMQHQVALDTLFASEGGLCTVIGEHCCTYIPSTHDNWTLIHDRVQGLADFLKSQETTRDSWDLFSWLTTGRWYQVLLKIAMPFIVILILFCIFMSCVVPCLRQMMSKLITNTMVRYTLLLQRPEEEEDAESPV